MCIRDRLKALYEKQWESIMGNCDEFLYLGGNETSTHKLISENYLGKSTLWLDTYGKSTGHSGSYSTNNQITGRELLTPDEVRICLLYTSSPAQPLCRQHRVFR